MASFPAKLGSGLRAHMPSMPSVRGGNDKPATPAASSSFRSSFAPGEKTAAPSPGNADAQDDPASFKSTRSHGSSKFLSSPSSRILAGARAGGVGNGGGEVVDYAPMLLHPESVSLQTVESLDDEDPVALFVAAKFGLHLPGIVAALKAKGPSDLVVAALFAVCSYSSVDYSLLVKNDLTAEVWNDLLESGSRDIRRCTLRTLRILLPRVVLVISPSGVFEQEMEFEAAQIEAVDFLAQMYRRLCDALTSEPDDSVVTEVFEALDEVFSMAHVPEKLLKRIMQQLTHSLPDIASRVAWACANDADLPVPACASMLRVVTKISLGHYSPHPLTPGSMAPLMNFIDGLLIPLCGLAQSGSLIVSLTAATSLIDLKHLVPSQAPAMIAHATNAALVCLGVLDSASPHMPAATRSALKLKVVELLSRAARVETHAKQRFKLLARCASECTVDGIDDAALRVSILQSVALDMVEHGSDSLGVLLKGALGFVWKKDHSGRQLLAHAILSAALSMPMDGSWFTTANDVLTATADVLTWKSEHGTLAGRAFILLLHAVASKSPATVVDIDDTLIEHRLSQIPEGAVKYRLLFQLESSFASRKQHDPKVGTALVRAFAHSLRPGSLGFSSMLSALVHLAQTVPSQAVTVQHTLTQLAKAKDLSMLEKDCLKDVRVRLMSPLRLHASVELVTVAFAPKVTKRVPVHAQLSGGSDPLYVTGMAEVVADDVLLVTLRASNVSRLLLVDVRVEVGLLGSMHMDGQQLRGFGNVAPSAFLTWTFAISLVRGTGLVQRGLDVAIEFSGTRVVLPTWRLPYLVFFKEGAPGLFSFTPGWVEADQFRDAWSRFRSSLVCQVASQPKYSLVGAAVPGFARAKSASVRVGMFAATTWGGRTLLVVCMQSGSVLGVEVRAAPDVLEGLNIRALAEEMFPLGRVDCVGSAWVDGVDTWALPSADAFPPDFAPDFEQAEKAGVARWQRMLRKG